MMRHFLIIVVILLLLTAATACAGAPTPFASPLPAPTAVVMTSGPSGEEPNASPHGHEPEEEFETEPPLQTAWPEPEMVEYGGKYRSIAEDREPSRYPSLKLGRNAIETTWGALKLPEGWTVAEADGPQPVIMDSKGRKVGMIYQMDSFPTEPWFSLKLEEHTPIIWETPDYPLDARVLTVESNTPSAAESSRKTIIRQIAVITGGPVFDDSDTACYMAVCLLFDKAYIDGDKVEYIASNRVIDEIARSFIEELTED